MQGIDLAIAMSEPQEYINDGDDFTQLQVTNGNTVGGYISTVDAGGTLIQEAQLPGIAVQIGTDGDDNDGSFLARQTAVGAFDITINSGRRLAFESRFKVVQGAEVGIFVGLAEAGLDQDLIVDSTGAIQDKDVIGFHCLMNATDVDIDCVTRIEGGTAINAATTITEDEDDDFQIYGFRFDGAETIHWYVDNVEIATQTIAAATFPTGEALTPTFCIKTGEAVEKDLTIDYWRCVQNLLSTDSLAD
jgi:hypothetical protein